jgi:hypothetical protein
VAFDASQLTNARSASRDTNSSNQFMFSNSLSYGEANRIDYVCAAQDFPTAIKKYNHKSNMNVIRHCLNASRRQIWNDLKPALLRKLLEFANSKDLISPEIYFGATNFVGAKVLALQNCKPILSLALQNL